MSNVVLPALAGLKYPVSKTPMWSGKVQTAVSGKETRLSYWSYPRWKWTIGYEVLRSTGGFTDLQQLVGFYNARYGQFDDWLFSDPDDNAVTAQLFGTGDGTTTTFQLVRTYGGFTEPCVRPNTVAVFNNGSPASVTYAGDGIVVFATAPAVGRVLTWTGDYYWRVRWDDMDFALEKMMGGLWSSADLSFTSIK